MRSLLAILVLPLLASCSQASAPDDTVAATAAQETPAAAATPDEPGDLTAIPAAMQGRWGMTANDCDPARSDNKGLMVVEGNTLRFYESRGTLDEVMASGVNQVRARFAYAGEGMEWEREEVLQLDDGGQTLVRRQFDEEGEQGPFTYRRCV